MWHQFREAGKGTEPEVFGVGTGAAEKCILATICDTVCGAVGFMHRNTKVVKEKTQ